MNAKTSISPILLAAITSIAACDEPEEDSDLRIVMTASTDELATPTAEPVDDIRLTVEEIRVHHVSEGWISVDPAEEDGVLYFGEMPLAIAHATLPEGEYDQLRLIVGDAEIFVGTQAFPLEIPSGETSGFKLHGEFCVVHHDHTEDEPEDDPQAHELVLRWDVDAGIRYSDERGYWLVPSVQIESAPACPQ